MITLIEVMILLHRFFDDNRSSAGRHISIRLGKVTCCRELPCTAT